MRVEENPPVRDASTVPFTRQLGAAVGKHLVVDQNVFDATGTGGGHHDAVSHRIASGKAFGWLIEDALLDLQSGQANWGGRGRFIAFDVLAGRGLALRGRGVDDLRLTVRHIAVSDGVGRGAFGLAVRCERVVFTDDVLARVGEHLVIDFDVGNSHVAGVAYREPVFDLIADRAVVVTVFAPRFFAYLKLCVCGCWDDFRGVSFLEVLWLTGCWAGHGLSSHGVLERLARVNISLRHPVFGLTVEGFTDVQRELLVVCVNVVAVDLAIEFERFLTVNPGTGERDVVKVSCTRILELDGELRGIANVLLNRLFAVDEGHELHRRVPAWLRRRVFGRFRLLGRILSRLRLLGRLRPVSRLRRRRRLLGWFRLFGWLRR